MFFQNIFKKKVHKKTLLFLDKEVIEFKKNRRSKRLKITIKPFEPIRVMIPWRVSYTVAEQFVQENKQWIIDNLAKARHRESLYENTQGPVDKNKARKYLIWRISELAKKHGYEYGKVSVRNQKTRWGSCSGKDNISLNMNLMSLPKELIDYVILHELAHTRQKNHSFKFWLELAKNYDNNIIQVKGLDKALNQYSPQAGTGL